MSRIVYTTAVSPHVRNAFNQYIKLKEKKATQVEINAAFCGFASACEKENKEPLAVFDELTSE